MSLLQKYNEYEKARSELIADMRKLRNEISDYIDNNGLEDEIHYDLLDCGYDPYPNEDKFDIKILGNNVVFEFYMVDVRYGFDDEWIFTYQPHWDGLSVEEIVSDIVKQSKALFDSQRERAIKEIKRRADELGISVSVNTGEE